MQRENHLQPRNSFSVHWTCSVSKVLPAVNPFSEGYWRIWSVDKFCEKNEGKKKTSGSSTGEAPMDIQDKGMFLGGVVTPAKGMASCMSPHEGHI